MSWVQMLMLIMAELHDDETRMDFLTVVHISTLNDVLIKACQECHESLLREDNIGSLEDLV